MAAPSSAQTRPSQIASTAPAAQPSMACGPPIAATMSGMVMNGPTPIMSVMFSAMALLRVTPRIRRGSLIEVGAGRLARRSGAGRRHNTVHAQVLHHLSIFVAAVDHRVGGGVEARD